jgi:uncharacterized protein (TIGR02118 family)
MVKLSVLYGHPKSPEAFEKYYLETHMPLAAKMQGIRRMELAKVTGTIDGSAPAFYRTADLYFDDVEQMNRLLASPEGQATIADLANFATGGVTTLLSQVL